VINNSFLLFSLGTNCVHPILYVAGDSEFISIFKFLKRSVETFGRNHGVQLALPKETGARALDETGKFNRKVSQVLYINFR